MGRGGAARPGRPGGLLPAPKIVSALVLCPQKSKIRTQYYYWDWERTQIYNLEADKVAVRGSGDNAPGGAAAGLADSQSSDDALFLQVPAHGLVDQGGPHDRRRRNDVQHQVSA